MTKTTVKVLSLKQPYAELVVSGQKTIEIRKWQTKFRGEFYIHASLNPDKAAMKRFNYKQLPLGCIVGKAQLVNVKKYKDEEDFTKDQHKHLSSTSFGMFGFILENIEKTQSIPAKGKLNFWSYKIKTN